METMMPFGTMRNEDRISVFPIVCRMLFIIFIVACSQKTVVKQEEDDGSTVMMHRNKNLEIILKSNPTTGYRWEIATIDSTILIPNGVEYIADEVHPGMVGSGGRSIVRFRTVKGGKTSVRLIYRRPFENDVAPLKEYTLLIDVKR